MKYGYYADNEIPKSVEVDRKSIADYKTNSHGYRCPEWSPLPEGKKNVVILGCSHTFGEGLEDGEVWVDQLYAKVDQKRLRFWNLGQPGASPDKCVRILYGSEKVLFPNIIIVCWPFWGRRERLDHYPKSLTSYDEDLKIENEHTDRNNFLKNVFFVEKFAEKNNAKVFHCFAQDVYEIPGANNVFSTTSIKLCWPEWSRIKKNQKQRVFVSEPSLAKDGTHYGVEHHKVFAKEFYNFFKSKLK
jgi:hypothetical protein